MATTDSSASPAIVQSLVHLTTGADGVGRVGRTRVTLDTIVAAFRKGAAAEEIAAQYPALDLADVDAVIGYYLLRQPGVDSCLSRRQEIADQVRKDNDEARCNPHGIRERLLARRKRVAGSADAPAAR